MVCDLSGTTRGNVLSHTETGPSGRQPRGGSGSLTESTEVFPRAAAFFLCIQNGLIASEAYTALHNHWGSRVARCCLDIWVRVYMVLLTLYLLFLKTKVLYKCTHIQNLQKCMHALYPRFLMGSFPFDEGIPFLITLLLLPSSSKGLQQ